MEMILVNILEIFASLPAGGKSTGPVSFVFFNICPVEFFEFCFNPGAKLDDHRIIWKRCLHYENYVIYQLYVRFEIR